MLILLVVIFLAGSRGKWLVVFIAPNKGGVQPCTMFPLTSLALPCCDLEVVVKSNAPESAHWMDDLRKVFLKVWGRLLSLV